MAHVKPLDKCASRFASITSQRSTEYGEGVTNPRVDWEQATAAAEENFKSAVTQAAQRGAFGKGVRKAGTAKWQKAAKEKGASRFASGVAGAAQAYQEGVAPYHQALSSLTLPPRYPRRDPRNLQRVAVIAAKLGQVKEGQTS